MLMLQMQKEEKALSLIIGFINLKQNSFKF